MPSGILAISTVYRDHFWKAFGNALEGPVHRAETYAILGDHCGP